MVIVVMLGSELRVAIQPYPRSPRWPLAGPPTPGSWRSRRRVGQRRLTPPPGTRPQLVLLSARVAALFSTLRDFSFTSAAALRFAPKPLCLTLGIDPVLSPPLLFRADIMERSVMKQAKRHRPFIARLARQRARLGKLEMMRLAW